MRPYKSLWHLAQSSLKRLLGPDRPSRKPAGMDPLIGALGLGDSLAPRDAQSSAASETADPATLSYILPSQPAPAGCRSAYIDRSLARPSGLGAREPLGEPLPARRHAPGSGPIAMPDVLRLPRPGTPPAAASDDLQDAIVRIAQQTMGSGAEDDQLTPAARSETPRTAASSAPASGVSFERLPTSAQAAATTPGVASSGAPQLRVSIENREQFIQQIVREMLTQINQQLEQQIRVKVTGPAARLQAQTRNLYR